MILEKLATFYTKTIVQNNEGTTYTTVESYLEDVPCHMQMNEGPSQGELYLQPYGYTAEKDKYVLFTKVAGVKGVVKVGDIVNVDSVDYEIGAILDYYSTHVEMIVKETIK